MAIKTDVATPNSLFENAVIYAVPPYQRAYVWTEDKQWQPLWEDILSLASDWETLIKAGGPANRDEWPAHFLGAMVFKQEPTLPTATPIHSVIDGQQRLTTLQLLLGAAESVFRDRNLPAAKGLRKLVANDTAESREKGTGLRKIRPTLIDEEAFLGVMNNDNLSGGQTKPRLVAAHEFFSKRIQEYLDSEPKRADEQAGILMAVLGHLLKIVVIKVDSHDDSQLIFETLNARGTPLEQSELVKNYLIHQATRQDLNSANFENEHLKKFREFWFLQEARQGRVYRRRMDQLLSHWIIMRTGQEVQIENVFQTIKRYAEKNKTKSIEEISRDIDETATLWRRLLVPAANAPLHDFLERYNKLDVQVATPILLWLLRNEGNMSPGVVERSVAHIESYLIRRAICGLYSTGLNKVIVEVVERLIKKEDSVPADVVIADYLSTQSGQRQWPTDARVTEDCHSRSLYGSLARPRLNMILRALNDAFKTSLGAPAIGGNLTIEHIMPQNWRNGEWGTLGQPESDQRDSLIHTIGNLILVTGPLNSAMADISWENKQEALRKHDTLFLNKRLLDRGVDEWDEEAISDRAKDLADAAIRIWPRP